jgi:predicted GNAT family acetyltransferase
MVNGILVKRLHYLSDINYHDQTHFTLSLGRRIIGIGGVQVNPYNPSQLRMQHVSVEQQYQGKGFARQILSGIYEYADRNNLKVVPSSFSKMGQRLKHIHTELDAKYPRAASGIPHKDL